MRNRIEIWHKENGEDVELISFENPTYNPFKKGMKFHFSVEEMWPKTIDAMSTELNRVFAEKWAEELDVKFHKYHTSRFKIVSEFFSVKHDVNRRANDGDSQEFNITYHVKKCHSPLKWTIDRYIWKFKRLFENDFQLKSLVEDWNRLFKKNSLKNKYK